MTGLGDHVDEQLAAVTAAAEPDPVLFGGGEGRPLIWTPRIPEAFVRLSPDATVSDDGSGQVTVNQPMPPYAGFERNVITLAVSREMAIDYGLVEPTEEERVVRAAHAEEVYARVLEQRAAPGPELTLESLLEHLGWPAEFAAHRLHPACWCDDLTVEDPQLCSWAVELGWRIDWQNGAGPKVVHDG